MPESDIHILPEAIILRICNYLVGERKKNFSIESYKQDLARGLFRAVPGLWSSLRTSFSFHRVIRGALEEEIIDDLQIYPPPVNQDVYDRLLALSGYCLAAQQP